MPADSIADTMARTPGLVQSNVSIDQASGCMPRSTAMRCTESGSPAFENAPAGAR